MTRSSRGHAENFESAHWEIKFFELSHWNASISLQTWFSWKVVRGTNGARENVCSAFDCPPGSQKSTGACLFALEVVRSLKSGLKNTA